VVAPDAARARPLGPTRRSARPIRPTAAMDTSFVTGRRSGRSSRFAPAKAANIRVSLPGRYSPRRTEATNLPKTRRSARFGTVYRGQWLGLGAQQKNTQ
jgi:hypothetical protein